MSLKTIFLTSAFALICLATQAQANKEELNQRYEVSLGGRADSLVSKSFFEDFNWVVASDKASNFALVDVKGFTIYIVPKTKGSPAYFEQIKGNKIPEATIQRIHRDADAGTMVVITEILIESEEKEVSLNGPSYKVIE